MCKPHQPHLPSPPCLLIPMYKAGCVQESDLFKNTCLTKTTRKPGTSRTLSSSSTTSFPRKYKAELVGIHVIITEESYTSKSSFLDGDEIPKYDPKREEKPTFSGKRITRGLYRAKDGHIIHADVQGAYNMMRKVAPKLFNSKGVED